MSAEENKKVVRRFVEDLLNRGETALAGELIAPDARLYFAGTPEPLRGPAGILHMRTLMRGAFPDLRWTIEDLVAEGDRVALRVSLRGTHEGLFLGIEPTGRPLAASGMAFMRLERGRIVEDIALPDLLGILQQLGGWPLPAADS